MKREDNGMAADDVEQARERMDLSAAALALWAGNWPREVEQTEPGEPEPAELDAGL